MARGISIHIGLNSVDATRYGWDGTLAACEIDARDMRAIAEKMGFTPTSILTREATADRVLGVIRSAAKELVAGDTLLLTYAGHGAQIPDRDTDEPDQQDETWVLYDRQVLDDELHLAYGEFARGVRIVVFSDSCLSGSVTREAPGAANRAMPPDLARRDFENRRATYVAIAEQTPSVNPDEIAPCVLLISGCEDDQTSLDGERNGLFTSKLLAVWNGGTFTGSYQRLHAEILQRMPRRQTPRIGVVGQ